MSRLNSLYYLLLTGLAGGLLLIATYSLQGEYRLNVGELGDGPYLSGFNGDEAGQPRHRWTGQRAANCADNTNPAAIAEVAGLINLPLALNSQAVNTVRLNLRAAANPPTVTVLVNGQPVGQTRAETGTFKTVEFSIPPGAYRPEGTRIEIGSPAFKPAGDCRLLGVQVAEVRLLTAPGLRLPTLEAVLWAWLYCGAMGLFLLKLAGPGLHRAYWAAGAGSITLMPWLLSPWLAPGGLNLWYMPVLLPGLGLLAAVLALLCWQQSAGSGLAWLLTRLEFNRRWARNVLWAATLIYSLYALTVIMGMDYIGHADYADNAVAARNIIRGRGYSLDYAAQFYQTYSLPRPADTWPPLQPFLIVPFYLIFGATTWAAKLPNLLLVPALAWAIFYYGSRLFNRRAALGAALLSLLAVVPAFSSSPAFFETIAYPINDLVFTLLAFLALATLYLAATAPKTEINLTLESEAPGILPQPTLEQVPEQAPKQVLEQTPEHWDIKNGRRAAFLNNLKLAAANPWAQSGLWSGLLFLSKPSGILLLLAAGGWLLWCKYAGSQKLWLPWRNLGVLTGVAMLVSSPFLVRNLLQFGTPFRSTEQYDSWLTKWLPPDEHIYDLFQPFSSRELPNPRQLLEYGWDSNLNAVTNQFRKFFTHLLGGQLYPPLILILMLVGLAVLPRRQQGLAAMLGLSLSAYLLFINFFWHYEPRYMLVWIPWVYLLGLYGLSWLYDKIVILEPVLNGSDSLPGQKHTRSGGWLLTLTLLVLAIPGLVALFSEGPSYQSPAGIVAVSNWIKQNTPASAVIISRNVWELSFHSERYSVMVPNNATLEEIKGVMRIYKARYLQLDHLGEDERSINRQWGQRRALWPLLDLRPNYEGFKLLYNQGGLAVYEWNGN